MAIFRFDKPSVFDSSGEVGEITGFYMKGIFNQLMLMESPQGLKAKYVMQTPRDWDRFMRWLAVRKKLKEIHFFPMHPPDFFDTVDL